MGRIVKKHGVFCRLNIAVVLLLSSATICAQELRVGFCRDSSFVNIEYQTAIRKSVDRMISMLDPNFQTDIRFIECPSIPSSTFYGSPEAVYGREEAMAMMVEASYWSAAILSVRHFNMSSAELFLSNCCVLDWIDIYRLAKAKLYFQYDKLGTLEEKIMSVTGFTTTELDEIRELVEELHYTENGFWEASKPHSSLFAIAFPIYQALMDNLTAFIIGHELYHFNDNSQTITTKSDMEEKGLFETFYSLQYARRLFDPELVQSDKEEINADRSGFRFLEFVDSNTKGRLPDIRLQTAIRKSTIDLLAFPVLSGFDLTKLKYNQPVETGYTPGYLYPMIRMMMITAVLQGNELENPWAVKMCGNTSKAIVSLMQTYASGYEQSDGEVPNEVLDLLPSGVTIGWESNHWNNQSFECKPSN